MDPAITSHEPVKEDKNIGTKLWGTEKEEKKPERKGGTHA